MPNLRLPISRGTNELGTTDKQQRLVVPARPTCQLVALPLTDLLTRLAFCTVAQIALTVLILCAAIFLLGFIADPIINLYLDPWSTLIPFREDDDEYVQIIPEERISWFEHFFKGTASLGVLGFVKVLLSSPWHLFRLGGGGRGRPGRTGRDRAGEISWILILIGVGTFALVS